MPSSGGDLLEVFATRERVEDEVRDERACALAALALAALALAALALALF